jgi:ABC-type uncharacterized transport system involved in gliding motility auxiliary subunit
MLQEAGQEEEGILSIKRILCSGCSAGMLHRFGEQSCANGSSLTQNVLRCFRTLTSYSRRYRNTVSVREAQLQTYAQKYAHLLPHCVFLRTGTTLLNLS